MYKPTGNSRGAPRKPTALKLLENIAFKEIPENEPQPERTMPRPPDYLSHTAKAIWYEQGQILYNLGLMTEADGPNFALFCSSYAELCQIEEVLQVSELTYESPYTGNITVNPIVTLAHKLRDQVSRYSSKFGMSPQARAGLSVDKPKEDGKYKAWKKRKKGQNGAQKKKTA